MRLLWKTSSIFLVLGGGFLLFKDQLFGDDVSIEKINIEGNYEMDGETYVFGVNKTIVIDPEIKSSNKIVKALGERLAMNAPIQGSAADIIKLAMVKVYNRIKKENLESQMILQVHDELILNVKENELEIVKALVKEEMENVIKLKVPLLAEVEEGYNWYEAK